MKLTSRLECGQILTCTISTLMLESLKDPEVQASYEEQSNHPTNKIIKKARNKSNPSNNKRNNTNSIKKTKNIIKIRRRSHQKKRNQSIERRILESMRRNQRLKLKNEQG